MKRIINLLGAFFLFGGIVPAMALATPISYTFTKIVDTNTPIPSGSGTFTNFSAPSLDNGNVAFLGYGSGNNQGIYTDIGGLNRVADTSTPIPSGSGTFTIFRAPSLDNGNVAFFGNGSDSQVGIYTDIGGLNRVADTSTPIPSGSGLFENFGQSPSFDNGNVAFSGIGGTQGGIYTDIGGLNLVADKNTANPAGSGTFTGLARPSLNNGNVAFVADVTGNIKGIYTDFGGLNLIADQNTAIPNGSGTFTDVDNPSLDNGNVAFKGAGSGSARGIYTDIGGLNRVADTSTPIPSGSGTFTSFGEPSLDNGNVAFEADGSGTDKGIYIYFGGALVKVISLSDTIDGKPLSAFLFGSEGLSGTSLAFGVFFVDGSRGIFRVDLTTAFQPVTIDIKPGSDPNCFNINGHGVIPVAILGAEDFDVTQIDLASLLFGGLEVRVRGNKGPLCSLDHSNEDAYFDLICHFEDDDPSAWETGDGEATLTGNLFDGTSIAGSDSICIVP